MTPQAPQDNEAEFEDDFEATADEAEDWDEETLGLDWNEADAQSLVQEVTRLRP